MSANSDSSELLLILLAGGLVAWAVLANRPTGAAMVPMFRQPMTTPNTNTLNPLEVMAGGSLLRWADQGMQKLFSSPSSTPQASQDPSTPDYGMSYANAGDYTNSLDYVNSVWSDQAAMYDWGGIDV